MDKADLETLLYARAACAGAEVYAQNGRLYCAEPDNILQSLLSVYNRFFERENKRFLEQDIRYEKALLQREHKIFDDMERYLGPCGRAGYVLFLNTLVNKADKKSFITQHFSR